MDFRVPRGPGETGPTQEACEISWILISGFVSKEGRAWLTHPPGLHTGGAVTLELSEGLPSVLTRVPRIGRDEGGGASGGYLAHVPWEQNRPAVIR